MMRLRQRLFPYGDTEGPDSLIGVTEAGKAALWLVFCLALFATLVAAFWISS